jgi:hypothetical protein
MVGIEALFRSGKIFGKNYWEIKSTAGHPPEPKKSYNSLKYLEY